ncbi:MAG: PLP-dependent transferase [Candidatus Eremiobacteraeota bacterium]|nr:PLP-dependent transferase [Candidatus Eremiobacteraeota bacterium]
MKFDSLTVHAGRAPDPGTGAVVPPIHLSTTFERDADGAFSRGYSYIRDGNPNCQALETCLRELEGGAEAIALSSGTAASFAVVQSLAPGDRIVASRDLYYGFRQQLTEYFPRWGIEASFVDVNDDAELSRALQSKPKMLWIETPSNPLIEVIDIARCAKAAHDAGAALICENSFASPALQRPLELGADVVVHSVTKYLAGHSDVMAGAVVVRESGELAARVRQFEQVGGAVLGPFDAWLALRGIQTLGARMEAHSRNAQAIATALRAQPKVARVYYPGLPDDPGHAIAKRQMRAFGGMLAFEVRGGRAEAFATVARLQTIVRATSLGGTHSLIEHRASIEGPQTRAPEGLLRLSVGIEDVADLIADLERALG